MLFPFDTIQATSLTWQLTYHFVSSKGSNLNVLFYFNVLWEISYLVRGSGPCRLSAIQSYSHSWRPEKRTLGHGSTIPGRILIQDPCVCRSGLGKTPGSDSQKSRPAELWAYGSDWLRPIGLEANQNILFTIYRWLNSFRSLKSSNFPTTEHHANHTNCNGRGIPDSWLLGYQLTGFHKQNVPTILLATLRADSNLRTTNIKMTDLTPEDVIILWASSPQLYKYYNAICSFQLNGSTRVRQNYGTFISFPDAEIYPWPLLPQKKFLEIAAGTRVVGRASSEHPNTGISAFRLSVPTFPDSNIVLVNTPAFNDSDTGKPDIEILRILSGWLNHTWVTSRW